MKAFAGALVAGMATAVPLIAASGVAQVPYAPAEIPMPGPSTCPGGLCQGGALEGLFEALAATEAGSRTRPVHIVQIGDSHTAGDGITGALRADFQMRFGRAGRGVLPAGVPYEGYSPYQAQVFTAGWISEAPPLQPPGGRPSPSVGLAGMRGQGAPGTSLTFVLEPGAEASLVGLCGRARGPGPGVRIVGAAPAQTVDLNGGVPDDAVCVEAVLPEPSVSIELEAIGAGVVLDSVRIERLTPGVMVSNLGVVGATLRDLAGRDEAVVATELAVWRPSLIVLAFGTNEGFDDGLDAVAYETMLRGQVTRLRRLAPATSLMLLGAPDALRSGVTGGCGADGQRAPPPSLAVVRDVQRRVAADMGVAFWDWRGRMGGDCSADRLATMGEPLMRGDRVHFTSAGADWIGGVLAADLMAAYDAWRAAREGAE